MIVIVHAVVSLGMLVILPLGLHLVSSGTTLRRWWWVAAVPGVLALWLPRGPVSIALASIYFAGTVVLAIVGLFAARRVLGEGRAGKAVAMATAFGTPAVAALALVAERASYPLFGFKLSVLSLTVAHFHFAGFAAALVAFLVAGAVPGKAADLASYSVPVGTLVVLLGFFVGDWLELVGAAILTAGMWLVGWCLLRLRAGADRVTRVLLATSGGILAATMVLALSWALGHVVDTPYLPIEWMAATHGVANALGFALCGLLAFRRLAPAKVDA